MDEALARLHTLERHPFSTLKALRGVTGCGSDEALRRMHGVPVWRESVESIWATTSAFFDVAAELSGDSRDVRAPGEPPT